MLYGKFKFITFVNSQFKIKAMVNINLNSTINFEKTEIIEIKNSVIIINKQDKIVNFSKEEKKFIEKAIKSDETIINLSGFNNLKLVIVNNTEKADYKQAEALRIAGNKVFAESEKHKIEELNILSSNNCKNEILYLTEGVVLSSYKFLKYFKDAEKKITKLKTINILNTKAKQTEIDTLKTLINSVFVARDLVNEPVNYLTAEKLADEIKKIGKNSGFDVEVFGKNKIESLKMGGLLAVNKGSIDPPTFTIVTWKPKNAKNKKPIVLVGKGVVFDTGGLSLKPTAGSMDEMKCDMAGAAAVAGTIKTLAETKTPVYVIGLIPATDNRPGQNAYAPQDVIKMYNGSTVEVLNTDAEGRMILADALSYAKQFDPELVIDLATLTGSAVAAIGHYGIVGMGNAKPEIFDKLKQSGENTYERIVEFPFWEEYDELIKSDIADLKNVGGKYAGAITAGKFLEHFTDYPYIHLDIAGPAYLSSPDKYNGKNGTGVGVRLLFDFFKNM
jgi:leucyl aminopeptidase